MKVGALVLAAGYSRRFGEDKRRFPVDGEPLLARTLEKVRSAAIPVRVCLRPGEGNLPLELGLPGLEFIECAHARQGMGATLADGVRACGDWDALLVVLGDMPWVLPDTYVAVCGALARDRIVQPYCEGRGGHPVGFGADFFPELEVLEGDRGGRVVIERHPDALQRLPVRDPGIHADLDETPEQR
jgi:molybdenum cofactor cytidylyltransferase